MNAGRLAILAWFCGTSLVAAGCGDAPGEPGGAGGGPVATSPTSPASPAPPLASAPTAAGTRPILPDARELDRDGSRVEDRLEAEVAALADPTARVRVEAIFTRPPTDAEVRAFEAEGGRVTHVFRAVSHGFLGTLPGSAVRRVAARLGPDLIVLAGDAPLALHLDRATRQGRVRPVWAPGFAGSAAGFAGTPTTTIGVMDTGVDDTHPDLAGRSAFFKDYTADAHATPADLVGHGTHVAGIALGSGAAFGVGPAKLAWTDSATLAGIPAQSALPSAVHLPAANVQLAAKATWIGGGNTILGLLQAQNGADNWQPVVGVQGNSPLSLAHAGAPPANARWSLVLVQNQAQQVGSYAIAASVSTYPAVGDGQPALRGAAPGCKWAGAKVFADSGAGDLAHTSAALDDLVAQRAAISLKVLNMSFGLTPAGSQNAAVRAKVNTAVSSGVFVVVSTGNDGPSGGMSDPPRAGLALTVGATNPLGQVTDYTTPGFAAPGADEDDKPDLVAPGGSVHFGHVLAPDSNGADGAGPSKFADQAANDYANLQGSSMAAPLVAGSAALVIQALEAAGATWDFASPASALGLKALLCASATETNQGREGGTNSPTLGRAAAPKDHAEGYGLVNPDAAIEAASLAWAGGTVTGTTTGSAVDRRAWGRKIAVKAGEAWTISATMDATADFDLYLYASTPDARGNPVIVASSTNAGAGVAESIAWKPPSDGVVWGFVKRVSGSGGFTVTGGPAVACAVEGGPCDDGDACTTGEICKGGACGGGVAKTCVPSDACHVAGTCDKATGACSNPVAADGKACSDGDACTTGDACKAGVCAPGAPKTCVASDACHAAGTCDKATGVCSNPALPDGAACDDKNACTTGDACKAGVCAPAATKTCAAIDACHAAGTCVPQTGACTTPPLPDGTACDDGDACTQGDACVAGGCKGGAPKTCVAIDGCHAAGTCDKATGACSTPALPDGTACNDGDACTSGDACKAGTCTASVVVACPAIDGCHAAGVCNPATGVCSSPALPDGTACDDGDACTQGDACKAGTCAATPVTCPAPAACHAPGTCDKATGACTSAPLPDGAACSDGDLCTQGDACLAGACVASPVTCPAPDACHDALGCAPATGACAEAPKPDGTPCPGGLCVAGACVPDGAGGAGGGAPDAGVGGGAPDAGAGGAPVADAGAGGNAVTDAGAGGGATSTDAGATSPDAGAGGAGATITARTDDAANRGADLLNGRACTCGVPGERPASPGAALAGLAAVALLAARRARRRAA